MRNDKLSELFDRVQNVPCPTREIQELGNILCQLIEEVQRIDNATSRAANIASCLANGIQPD